LLAFRNARSMLRAAGCPFESDQIGISRERLRVSYEQAYYIRRRFTVLDLAQRLGVFDSALNEMFRPGEHGSHQGSPA
jgi:glycerol-1-phosphate dehydrogenase [NAD(P)+]